jgi:hypothetical protein
LSPFWYQKTRRPNQRNEAHYLVFATLPLVIVLVEPLAGSPLTVPPPALRYSPVRRGDSIYYPATPERSPTPLEEPIDWEPVYHNGATTDSTIVPASTGSRTHVNPIDYPLRRVYLPSEVSEIIREGIQLGVQQRAEEQCRQEIWERIFEIRTRIEERLNCEERAPPSHPPFPNLVPRRWFRGAPPRPFLRNRIAPLRPRESLRLPTHYREDYSRH